MKDVIEIFDGVKNAEFKGLSFGEMPVFALKELAAEDWNKRARIQNTRMFIQTVKRMPKDYAEVLAWINEESHSAGNTVALN